MFGVVSRIRSFLGYSGPETTEYEEYEYDTEGDTIDATEESDGKDWDHDDLEPVVSIAPEEVRDIESVSDITGIGTTRASQLDAAGFVTPADVYFADDEDLADVDGIGPYTVEQVRDDIGSP